MYENTDSKKIVEDEHIYRKFKKGCALRTEGLWDMEDMTLRDIEYTCLWDCDALQYDPNDRVVAVLPLVLLEAEKRGFLSDAMRGELYGTLEDYNAGLITDFSDEELAIIKADIDRSFELTGLDPNKEIEWEQNAPYAKK